MASGKTVSGQLAALGLLFAVEASAQETTEIQDFPTCATIDGQSVDYVPLDAENPRWRGRDVAFARYDSSGAYIYYDPAVYRALSPLARTQISEHECAHHRLGHSLQSMNYRRTESYQASNLIRRKENDADCEAAYRLIGQYGISRETLGDIFTEINRVVAGSEDMNDYAFARMVRAQECHDGFWGRPSAFTTSELTP